MAVSQATREQVCCETLNNYIFHNIWNEPSAEFRDNIKPLLLSKNSYTGSFSLRDSNVYLPTVGEAYYLWSISTNNFHIGLNIDTNVWIDTATLANEYGTLFHMFGVNGKMFAKAFTYIYMNTSKTNLIIAAKKNMVKNCIHYIRDEDNVITALEDAYITVYHDSDNSKDISVLSIYLYNVTISSRQQAYITQVNNFLSQCTNIAQLTTYENGYETTSKTSIICPALTEDTYLDIIIDKNILFAFDIDLVSQSTVVGNQNPVYFSTRDKIYKQLIHIPKQYNPDNKIITHNTCDFYVRRKYQNEELATKTIGLYLHRASTNHTCIFQVTHNDMSVPLNTIEAYRDYIEAQEVCLHCVVRYHNKQNYLTPDASYINLLYSEMHTDDTIINILCGNGPSTIPWWTADNLEQSTYVAMMFDSPNFAGTDKMQTYVDAMGFYQVVNVICKRIFDTTITDSFTGEFTFSLPALYYGMTITPVLYLNGQVIDSDYFTYSCYPDVNKVYIKLSDELSIDTGDKLTVIYFIDGNETARIFEPSTSNLNITVPFEEVSVYEILDDTLSTLDLAGNQHNVSYYKRPLSDNVYDTFDNEDGSKLIVFNSEYIGSKFLIESAYCSYNKQFDLDSYLESGDSIVIPLKTTLEDGTTEVPIFNYKNISVYLNNVYLVNGLDYVVYNTPNTDGHIVNAELVIQTLDHFKSSGNKVRVIINVAEIEDISSGFLINDTLQDKTPINLYYKNISTVHIDGKLERSITSKGTYMTVTKDKYQQGSIFEVQTAVPSIVKDFINKYSSNQDYERIKAMNEYFYSFAYTEPSLIALEDQHRIYSLFMNNFIQDIINGNRGIAADPDLERMKQQIKPYNYLKLADICFNDIDKRFLDLYPGLKNRDIDVSLKKLIDVFIKAFMPSNTKDSTVDIVYDN